MQIKKKIKKFSDKYIEDKNSHVFIKDFYKNYHFNVEKAKRIFNIKSFKRDTEKIWIKEFHDIQPKSNDFFGDDKKV